MAIRIRQVDGITVALCAAETNPKPGDIYLDDNAHHALSTKFGMDWQSEGLIKDAPIDLEVAAKMATQKLRDAKKELTEWLNRQPAPPCQHSYREDSTVCEICGS